MRRLLQATVAIGAMLALSRGVDAQDTAVPDIPAPARVFYGLTPQFAVAPDASQVVFVADGPDGPAMLWLRPLRGGTARPLAGTTQSSYPFWSADSKFIGFFAGGKLQRIAGAGGAPVIVCDAPNGRGGTWNASDLIVFTSGISDPLRKVPASGGQPVPASVLDTSRENSHRFPQFLPDGKHVLFWAGAGSAPPTLKIGSLDSTATVSVVPADTNGAYAGGYVFHGKGNVLMAQAIDPATFQKTGDPVRVGEPLSGDAGSSFGSFSVATDGTVLYTRGAPRPFVLTWFDRTGKVLGTVAEPGLYTNVALSPDDTRIAVSLTAGTPPNRDIWLLDAATGATTRITDHPAVDATPIWSPDGTKIVFSSQRDGPYQIYVRELARGTDEPVFKGGGATIATDWSPDGKSIAFVQGANAGVWEFGQTAAPSVWSGGKDNLSFIPGGPSLIHQAAHPARGGRSEVFISRISGELASQVSVAGGTQPLLGRDGKEVFFLAADGSVMSSRDGAPPTKLFSAPISLVIRRTYAVTSDGQRILMPILDDRVAQTIAVLPKWPASRSR